ncbi:uncharacterized protein [Hetaerina americana]|uniref:uncharacterized protein n=1 Tax=Hetaerina americana TaxID=62018 RepID=UPI003A7F2120
MTLIIFVAVAVAAVSSMPQFATHGVIPVLQRDEVSDDRGQFSLRYVSGDGTSVSEHGQLKPTPDGTDYVLVKQGGYTFTTPEGRTFTIEYIADENGFQPKGDAIPAKLADGYQNTLFHSEYLDSAIGSRHGLPGGSGKGGFSSVLLVAFTVFLVANVDTSSASPPMTTMQVVPILQREEIRSKSGEFSLKYVTGDGIVLAEVGRLKSTADGKDAVLVKEGSYSYTSPEGQVVKLSYVADERGFRPVAGGVEPSLPEEKQ